MSQVKRVQLHCSQILNRVTSLFSLILTSNVMQHSSTSNIQYHHQRFICISALVCNFCYSPFHFHKVQNNNCL